MSRSSTLLQPPLHLLLFPFYIFFFLSSCCFAVCKCVNAYSAGLWLEILQLLNNCTLEHVSKIKIFLLCLFFLKLDSQPHTPQRAKSPSKLYLALDWWGTRKSTEIPHSSLGAEQKPAWMTILANGNSACLLGIQHKYTHQIQQSSQINKHEFYYLLSWYFYILSQEVKDYSPLLDLLNLKNILI